MGWLTIELLEPSKNLVSPEASPSEPELLEPSKNLVSEALQAPAEAPEPPPPSAPADPVHLLVRAAVDHRAAVADAGRGNIHLSPEAFFEGWRTQGELTNPRVPAIPQHGFEHHLAGLVNRIGIAGCRVDVGEVARHCVQACGLRLHSATGQFERIE